MGSSQDFEVFSKKHLTKMRAGNNFLPDVRHYESQ
jgi:hypothetical protein